MNLSKKEKMVDKLLLNGYTCPWCKRETEGEFITWDYNKENIVCNCGAKMSFDGSLGFCKNPDCGVKYLLFHEDKKYCCSCGTEFNDKNKSGIKSLENDSEEKSDKPTLDDYDIKFLIKKGVFCPYCKKRRSDMTKIDSSAIECCCGHAFGIGYVDYCESCKEVSSFIYDRNNIYRSCCGEVSSDPSTSKHFEQNGIIPNEKKEFKVSERVLQEFLADPNSVLTCPGCNELHSLADIYQGGVGYNGFTYLRFPCCKNHDKDYPFFKFNNGQYIHATDENRHFFIMDSPKKYTFYATDYKFVELPREHEGPNDLVIDFEEVASYTSHCKDFTQVILKSGESVNPCVSFHKFHEMHKNWRNICKNGIK